MDSGFLHSTIDEKHAVLQRRSSIADVRPLLDGMAVVSLAYWLPQYDTWADQDGRLVSLPGPGDRRSVTLIDSDGRHLAALVHDDVSAHLLCHHLPRSRALGLGELARPERNHLWSG